MIITPRLTPAFVVLTAMMMASGLPASAQDGFNPFKSDSDEPRRERRPRADDKISDDTRSSDTGVTRDVLPTPVERDELQPVMSADGSGLPYELWQGLDLAKLEALAAEIPVPPASPALNALWKKLLSSESGDGSDPKFSALRLDLLYRSGFLNEIQQTLKRRPASDPAVAALGARRALAADNRDEACRLEKTINAPGADLPAPLKIDGLLLTGYCTAIANDIAGAGLAAELAREAGAPASPALDALDAIALGAKPKIKKDARLSILDYRLLKAAGAQLGKDLIDKAEPALLVAIANDDKADAASRLSAGESAARLNAYTPDELASLYRALAPSQAAEPAADAGAEAKSGGALKRAALFANAEVERSAMKKLRLIRAYIDDAKRAHMSLLAMRVAYAVIASVPPAQELSWFAESGAEIALAGGDYAGVKRWANIATPVAGPGGASNLTHWVAFADIIDPSLTGDRGQSLEALENLALRGRFPPDTLHRLATVLDALDANVPIPLWEAASKTPQPNSGHLPATGVLSELQDASKKKQFGRTVLLVMKTLGPDGAEGAHIIALGDAIRALKRAGLDAEARRVAFEALFSQWPRTSAN